MTTGLFVAGQWTSGIETQPVHDKFSGAAIGNVEWAGVEHVRQAIVSAQQGAALMARLPACDRAGILRRAAEAIQRNRESLAVLIASESGKPIKTARVEVDRATLTFQVAAEEASRIHGETLPLDASPSGKGYFGFWWRRPIGVVAAITPFNFPLNLVAHKLAPAIAAGNAFILKPAEQTPLTAVRLFEILLDAGLPPTAGQLLQGAGETIGDAIVTSPGVAKISFTGSAAVGQQILARAGIKKVTLELGNNSPVIVAEDADLDWVAQRCALGAFVHAGQVCISVQRIYAAETVFQELSERLVAATANMILGDPLDESTDVGPMISLQDAQRIEAWVDEARADGAECLIGGQRSGTLFSPTLLNRTSAKMRVMQHEVFAPVASLVAGRDFDDCLQQANATSYGLQAAVFTRDIDRILATMQQLDFGGVIVNDMPGFRVDHMPYGGNRQSGFGREGVRFAIEEMTNMQTVAIRSKVWYGG